MLKLLEDECSYQTQRLTVLGYAKYMNKADLPGQVLNIMTPRVTQALPSGWQDINTTSDADNWLKSVDEECSFLLVRLSDTQEIIGFVFLYEPSSIVFPIDVRIGYLLNERYWGAGIASELIKGFLTWCNSYGAIKSITGGVEADNIGSIKVLEKNGFVQIESNEEGAVFYVYNSERNG
ncbi:MAG: GNAT family N-acetyltransferase [Gammaproteobacteria bacterium]|nr:GNAT family N-acetyltransferase [Gammaproteobacteria bacterium]